MKTFAGILLFFRWVLFGAVLLFCWGETTHHFLYAQQSRSPGAYYPFLGGKRDQSQSKFVGGDKSSYSKLSTKGKGANSQTSRRKPTNFEIGLWSVLGEIETGY
ncbi:MAG TPA: hypothetical protein VFF29_04595, partial [Bacteroidota bacterium]|nr:hypothetical protein [Bacteroidota bacterium]